MNIVIGLILGLGVGAGAVYAYFHADGGRKLKKIQEQSEKEIAKVEKRVRDMEHKAATKETELKEKIIDAKNQALDIINEAKKEERERRQQLDKQEQRLVNKEDQLEKKIAQNDQMKEDYVKKTEAIQVQEEKLEALYKEQEEALTKVAKMSTEEAKDLLLKNIERDYQEEISAHYKKIESDVKEEADKKAKNIITQAIQKLASSVTSESTQTIVQLPNDDIKGRIIGREGRNINAFEHLTGVDVIVDDTPGAIVIAGFDLVRRYVAKRSLQKLIEDGRIHPARVESVVKETKEEVNEMMMKFGEKAVHEMGFAFHPDLVKIIGRLKFRTSYGQNVLKHSVEVGYLAGALAAEVGLNVEMAKMGGFLHDIGKAVDHEIEGSHALIGRDICKKYGLPDMVVNAVAAHHEEEPFESPEAIIVQVADAISASRPGARRETLQTYLKRLQNLEEIANSFDGIDKAYAVQAGREVRVMVKPDKIDDVAAVKLSHDIARKIESELAYPGTIKVNVLREMRATDVAR